MSGGRIGDALRTAASAPWRRAPLLLRRRPGVLATVAGASAVVAAALASGPLFLSSVGTGSVQVQAAERCARDTGATYRFAATPSGVRDPIPDPFVPLGDTLGPGRHWARLDLVRLHGDDPAPDGAPAATDASVLALDDFLDHIDVVDGEPGPGLWISDRAAAVTGLQIGDAATFGDDAARMPVAGVYRDLAGPDIADFWCADSDVLLPVGPDADLPPPVLLADRGTMAALATDLGVPRVLTGWEAALRAGDSVADVDELVQDLACRGPTVDELVWCAPGSASREQADGHDAAAFVEDFFQSHLPFVAARSRAIQTSVGGVIWPLAAFAAIAGGGLVAAAASLWFDRRRREVRLLTVRGVSPAGLGVKAVLELSIPLVVGAAAGVLVAGGMVSWLGPARVVEGTAITQAVGSGVGALALAAFTVALVVAARARNIEGRRRQRAWLVAVPWELLLVAATVVSYHRLGEWGVPVDRGADVSTVDVWGLMFPTLFLLTVVAVVSRLLARSVGVVPAITRSAPIALYLGGRRISRYRVAVVGLAAASAVAAGVLGYAATFDRSLSATLDAKALTYVGSDIAVRLPFRDPVPTGLTQPSTVVETYRTAWIGGRDNGVRVMAIDPATFGDVAFWDASFAEPPLATILERMAVPPADGGAIPAVIVGLDVDGPVDAVIRTTGTTEVSFAPVARASAFPGMNRPQPTVFVAASALDALDLHGDVTEVWIRGDRDRALSDLEAAGATFREDRRVDDIADRTSFLTVSWTFGYMRSLGWAAGILVLAGVAIYLDARRRDRVLGYAFARRMGLTRGQHRRALLLELCAGIVAGCWIGLAVAVVGAWLAYDRIDPVPGYRPAPLLRPAFAVVAALAAASVVVAVVAAALAQRRVDRDDPLEVLRAGT